MGGGWLGNASGEVSMISDRISAMTEVAKENKAAMVALKFGIVGAATALTVKMVKAMADYASGAELMRVKTEAAGRAAREAFEYHEKLAGIAFQDRLGAAGGLGSRDDRRQRFKKEQAERRKIQQQAARFQEQLNKDKQRVQDRIADLQLKMNERNGSMTAGANQAVESRFASGRAIQKDYAKTTADEVVKANKINAEQKKLMGELLAEMKLLREKESPIEVAR